MINIISKRLQLAFTTSLVCALLFACAPKTGEQNAGDKMLAQVHNHSLYLSELEGMVPPGSSSEDSSLIINAFVERWVREAVMLHEAELNVPKDLNIDKLVRDYRASLVRHNYEQILINSLLDSVVTEAQLKEFYGKFKDQFQTEEPLFRCYYLKVPKVAPDLNDLKKWWSNIEKVGNLEALRTYAATYASVTKLDEKAWYEVGAFSMDLPAGWISTGNMTGKLSFVREEGGFVHFFKTLEVISENSTPPMSYVEDKAKRVILHQRKQKLLDEKKEEMYQRELRRNNVKVY